MRERLSAVLYLAGWTLIRWIPECVGRRVFAWIADHVWRKRIKGVRRLETNLRRVIGPHATADQLRALSRASMRFYLRYFYEMFRLPTMSRRLLNERTHCVGIEKVEYHIRHGRGVLIALPHMGNWDEAGAWIALRGIPLTTVAERLKPESIFARFTRVRTDLGMEVLPLTGGEGNNAGQLVRRLRAGGLVCLLADRDLTSSGIEVSFFGESARMPAGPAVLAERTNAALMPVSLWYEGRCWCIRVHDEIPIPSEGDQSGKVRAMTQELAWVFEGAIAEHPEDWHMLQRVFTADIDSVRANPDPDGADDVAVSPAARASAGDHGPAGRR